MPWSKKVTPRAAHAMMMMMRRRLLLLLVLILVAESATGSIVVVTTFAPVAGWTTGGAVVDVALSHTLNSSSAEWWCRFGSTNVSATVLANDASTGAATLRCVAPPGAAGNATLAVAPNATLAFADAPRPFVYYPPLTAAITVLPASLPIATAAHAAATVTVTGAGFVALDARCVFDNGTATTVATVASSTTLTCPIPAIETGIGPGSMLVALTFNGVVGDVETCSGCTTTVAAYARPPHVASLCFSRNAHALWLSFDDATNLAGSTSAVPACSEILSGSGLALLGSTARCLWASEWTLAVQLGWDARIAPGDALTLRDGVVRGNVASSFPTATYPYLPGANMTVTSATPPPAPRLRLVVPATVGMGSRADLELQARRLSHTHSSFSHTQQTDSGSGGRAMMVQWSCPTTAALATLLSAHDNATHVSIAWDDLPAGTHTVTLTATNFLGETSHATATMTVLSDTIDTPGVAIVGGNRTVSRAEGFSLYARAWPSTASLAAGQTVLFSWDLWQYPLSAFRLGAQLLAATRSRHTLRVDPNVLTTGETYIFELTATMDGSSVPAVATTSITVLPQPPVAVISGGLSRLFTQWESITIDASGSSDPSGGALSYRWNCTASGSNGQTPCEGASGWSVADLGTGAATLLPAFTSLGVGVYDMSVTVTSSVSGLATSACQSVTIASDFNVPLSSLAIGSAWLPRAAAGDSSALGAACGGPVPERCVPVVDPGQRLLLQGAIVAKSGLTAPDPAEHTITWSEQACTGGQCLNLSDPAVATTTASGLSLVVARDALVRGRTHVFRLQVVPHAHPSSVGFCELAVAAASGPSGGRLDVSPPQSASAGDDPLLAAASPFRGSVNCAANGTITLRATAFEDDTGTESAAVDSEVTPLLYRFAVAAVPVVDYVHGTTPLTALVSAPGPDRWFAGPLPVGNVTVVAWAIGPTAGAASEPLIAGVMICETEPTDADAQAQLVVDSHLGAAQARGEMGTVLSVALSAATALNTAPLSPGESAATVSRHMALRESLVVAGAAALQSLDNADGNDGQSAQAALAGLERAGSAWSGLCGGGAAAELSATAAAAVSSQSLLALTRANATCCADTDLGLSDSAATGLGTAIGAVLESHLRGTGTTTAAAADAVTSAKLLSRALTRGAVCGEPARTVLAPNIRIRARRESPTTRAAPATLHPSESGALATVSSTPASVYAGATAVMAALGPSPGPAECVESHLVVFGADPHAATASRVSTSGVAGPSAPPGLLVPSAIVSFELAGPGSCRAGSAAVSGLDSSDAVVLHIPAAAASVAAAVASLQSGANSESYVNATCAAWTGAAWSTDGCVLIPEPPDTRDPISQAQYGPLATPNTTVCNCTHLTEFAVVVLETVVPPPPTPTPPPPERFDGPLIGAAVTPVGVVATVASLFAVAAGLGLWADYATARRLATLRYVVKNQANKACDRFRMRVLPGSRWLGLHFWLALVWQRQDDRMLRPLRALVLLFYLAGCGVLNAVWADKTRGLNFLIEGVLGSGGDPVALPTTFSILGADVLPGLISGALLLLLCWPAVAAFRNAAPVPAKPDIATLGAIVHASESISLDTSRSGVSTARGNPQLSARVLSGSLSARGKLRAAGIVVVAANRSSSGSESARSRSGSVSARGASPLQSQRAANAWAKARAGAILIASQPRSSQRASAAVGPATASGGGDGGGSGGSPAGGQRMRAAVRSIGTATNAMRRQRETRSALADDLGAIGGETEGDDTAVILQDTTEEARETAQRGKRKGKPEAAIRVGDSNKEWRQKLRQKDQSSVMVVPDKPQWTLPQPILVGMVAAVLVLAILSIIGTLVIDAGMNAIARTRWFDYTMVSMALDVLILQPLKMAWIIGKRVAVRR